MRFKQVVKLLTEEEAEEGKFLLSHKNLFDILKRGPVESSHDFNESRKWMSNEPGFHIEPAMVPGDELNTDTLLFYHRHRNGPQSTDEFKNQIGSYSHHRIHYYNREEEKHREDHDRFILPNPLEHSRAPVVLKAISNHLNDQGIKHELGKTEMGLHAIYVPVDQS